MPVLSRRLYNGGFNHLKCAQSLVRKPLHVVAPTSVLLRHCSYVNKAPEAKVGYFTFIHSFIPLSSSLQYCQSKWLP